MATTTQTPAPRQRKPRTKPARSIRLCVRPTPENVGVVRITVGAKSHDYLLSEVPGVAFGRGFLLEKIGHEESYHVCVNGRESLCDCPGFAVAKSGECKHVAGLKALVELGRL